MELRQYQTDCVTGIVDAFEGGTRRVLLHLPTGAGKTIIAAFLMAAFARHGKRSIFIAPRRELIYQTSDVLDSYGQEYGVYMAGESRGDSYAPMTLASIDTLRSRHSRNGQLPIPTPYLVIADEAHLYSTSCRTSVLDLWPEAYRIGLTATPRREDGKGLWQLFDAIVPGATVRRLVDEGYLSDAVYYSVSEPDLAKVRTVAADYHLGDLRSVMAGLVGDIVETWMQRASARRTAVFCVDISHSKALCAAFSSRGISSSHVDANTPTSERSAIFANFRNGTTQVLTNCQLASYGFDLPAMDCIVLARPTKSLTLYLQMVGRGLRPSEGKDCCLVLDHSGAVRHHGFADMERKWTLGGASVSKEEQRSNGATERELVPITCGGCRRIFHSRQDCPACGWKPEKTGNPVATMDGQLVLVDSFGAYKRKKKDISPSEEHKRSFYLQLAGYFRGRGLLRNKADEAYKEKFSEKPNSDWFKLHPEGMGLEVRNWLTHLAIKRAKGVKALDRWSPAQEGEYVRLLKKARESGFRDGWASHQFREAHGAFPPWSAQEAIKERLDNCK